MTDRVGDRRIGGIVLCGGQSIRMGSDKAWLPSGDRKLLQRTVEVLAEVACPIVVVKSSGQDLPGLPADIELAEDRTPDRGPLEGFMVGLQRVGTRCETVFAIGCDYPFLTAGFLSMLIERLVEGEAAEASVPLPACGGMGHPSPEVVVARVGGWLHPLAALYRVSVADRAETLVASGRRSMHMLLDHCSCRVIEASELTDVPGGVENLTNVNTPEEYAAALQRMSGGESTGCC